MTFADGTAETLPKYDADGVLYVYYTVERGLSGDYVQEVTGGQAGLARDEKGGTVGGTFVLSGCTLTNRLKKDAAPAAQKTYPANAMQSLEPDSTSATFKLQTSADDAGWTDETDSAGKAVTLVLGMGTGGYFRPENTTVRDSSVSMPQYDSEGHRLYYRWVEVGMTVNGASASTEAADGYADGEIVTADADGTAKKYVAPGVGTDGTTARFRVKYNADGSVTNLLVGNTQLRLTKVWQGGTAPVDSITVALFQNGAPYTYNGSTTYTLTSAQDWTALLEGLPRYDSNGNEYTYTVQEAGTLPEGWSLSRIDYAKTVETETSTQDRVTRTSATLYNVTGPGESLTFDVSKAWLDDSDLLSRREVEVGLYQKTGDSWNLVDKAALNEGNLWKHRFSTAKTAGVTADDFVVMEISAGSADVQNPSLDAAKAHEQAITGTGWFDGKTTADTSGSAAGTLGVLNGARDDNLNNQYYVYVGRNSLSGDHADYTVYNQRFGTVDLRLTKLWRAGGEVLTALFSVARTDTNAVVQTFEMGSAAADDPAKGLTVTAVAADAANPDQKSQTAVLTGLPKYDAAGHLLSYAVSETKVGGTDISGGTAVVDGDTYLCTVSFSGAEYAGDEKHRTGDLYTWAGSNIRQETYDLTVNKVWQDDGPDDTIARPDIRFTVWRTTAAALSAAGLLNSNSSTLAEQTADAVALLEKMDGTAVAALKAGKAAEVVSVDNLWNTTYNDWYWSCDLGKVERYDPDGYPYIYFLLETMSANTADYKTLYYNGGTLPTGGAQPNTAAVFPRSCADSGVSADTQGTQGGYGNILVAADGISEGSRYNQNKYSRTTVNYRQKPLTLRGKKLWRFPSGVTLSAAQLPEVTVSAFCSTVRLDSPTYADLNGSTDGTVTKVAEKTLNKGGNDDFSYLFTKDTGGKALQYYDSYGRSYYYYVAEESVAGYPELKPAANSFTLTNVYAPTAPWVKVTLKKTWASDIDGRVPAATAGFTLYAVCQSEADGTGTELSGTRLKVAAGTLTAQGAGTETLVFGGANDESYASVTYSAPFARDALPYYGPNGKPYRYILEETSLPNGYTASASTVGVTVGPRSGDTYEAAAGDITDTYVAGTTTYTAAKVWAGDSRAWVQDEYRPAALALTLHRRYLNGTAWTEDADYVSPVQNVTTAELSTEFTGLQKYAPNGSPYVYYVTEALQAGAGSDQQNRFAGYLQGTDANGTAAAAAVSGKLTNTLPTTAVAAKKVFALLKNGTGTPAAASDDQVRTLFALGALPQSITFTVQRYHNGAWEDVKSGAADGVSLATHYALTTLAGVNSLLQASSKGTLRWSNLPKYEAGYTSGDGHLVAYRVVETVTLKDGSSYTAAGDSTDAVSGGSWSSTAAVSGTAAAGSQKFTFTNTLPVREASIDKVWSDDSDQDGLRPAKVSFTLTRDGAGSAAVTLATDAAHRVDGSFNRHSTGIFYVPLYQNDSTGTYSTYTAAETAVTGYTTSGPVCAHTAGDPLTDTAGQAENWNAFTFTNTKAALTDTLTASKAWAGDGAWQALTRPDTVYLQLQYKQASEADTAYRPADADCGLASGDSAIHAASGTDWTAAGWTVFRNLENTTTTGSHPLAYRVVEMTLAGGTYTAVGVNSTFAYAPTGGTLAAGSAAMTLTNALKTTEVRLKKVWAAADGTPLTSAQLNSLAAAGALPRLRFTLYYKTDSLAAAQPFAGVGTVEYTPADTALTGAGASAWSGLPVCILTDGVMEKVTYSVQEEISYGGADYRPTADSNITAAYAAPAETAAANGNVTAVLTVTDRIELASLTVNKTWQDESDRDGVRPANITLQLLRDGAAYGSPVTVSAPAWSTVFENLPVKKAGSSTENSLYTVSETAVGSQPTAGSPYTAAYGAGSAAGGAALGVTDTYVPESFSITAVKKWADADSYGLRPASVDLTLTAQVTAADGVHALTILAGTLPAAGQDTGATVQTSSALTQTVSAANSWTAAWAGLPTHVQYGGKSLPVQYNITESGADAGYTFSAPADITSAGEDKSLEVTNSLAGAVTLTVQKNWDAAAAAADALPDSILVALQYRTGNGAWTDVSENGTRTLTAAGSWYADFTGLQNDREYRAVERSMTYTANGQPLTVNVSGLSDSGAAQSGTLGCYQYTSATAHDAGSSSYAVTLTNTLDTTALSADKAWANDAGNAYGTRPAADLTARLQRRTARTGWADVLHAGTPVTAALVYDAGTRTWGTAEFTGLPASDPSGTPYEYRAVEETAVPGYTSTSENDDVGHTLITNTLATADIRVEKHWDDQSNLYGTRPAALTLTLADQNGELAFQPVFTRTTFAGDLWGYLAQGLPKYLPGTDTPAEYTVREAAVPGYTGSAEAAVQNGTAGLTNTLDTVSAAGTKTWTDYGNRYLTRPDSLTLTVKNQNGALDPQPEISWTKQGDAWAYRIDGLPEYLPGTGTPAEYTVAETVPAHYRAAAAEAAVQNGRADFANTLVMPSVSLTIVKHSVTLGGARLANASYLLLRYNEDGTTVYYTGTDAAGAAVWSADRALALRITTGADGSASAAGIPYGDYGFEEVQAPADHELDARPVRITVSEQNRAAGPTAEQADPLTPTAAANTPLTGTPLDPAAAALAGLSGAGLVLLGARRRKRRPKPAPKQG